MITLEVTQKAMMTGMQVMVMDLGTGREKDS